jgi:RNA recognition motif-containing protein
MCCRSKGYGFCSFYTKADAENAMAKLSGSKIGSRNVRCGWAHHKKDAMQSIDYTTVDQVHMLIYFQLSYQVCHLLLLTLDAPAHHTPSDSIRPSGRMLLCRLTR